MPKKSTVRKTIKFAKNKFNLEIYLGLEKTLHGKYFLMITVQLYMRLATKIRMTKIIQNNIRIRE